MTNMPVFRPGLGAGQAHGALKTSIKITDQAHHCAVLCFGEIMNRELYRDLGYSTMRAYALTELGFSPTRAGDFCLLAQKLVNLPAVKKEMTAGRLGYTVAREIVSVADKSTEKEWLQEAREKPRHELIASVKRAKASAKQQQKDNPDQGELIPRPVPTAPAATISVHVGFELTPLQYARYEKIMAELDHRGSRAQLLLDSLEALLPTDKTTPRGVVANPNQSAPNYQIHIHQCPDCKAKSITTPKGEKTLSPAEGETVACDAHIHKPGQRNTTTIPPKTRREVLARDRHQCRRKGCSHTRYLDLHHLIPRAEGGTNKAENLVTLCPACHALWHDRGGDLSAVLTAAAAAG